MRKWTVLVVPALLVVAVAAAATGFAQSPTTVMTRTDPKLGTFLTDAQGMTLYQFTKDTTKGQSACYDKCAAAWPAFTAAAPLTLPAGVPGTLTTFARTDGTTQVAYNDIPLYHFAKDSKPGDTTGQGIGGVWFVVAPGAQFGAAQASPVASPMASPMASPSAGAAVTIKGFAFAPPSLTVAAGTTVTWTNQDSVAHTVTADDGSFDSGQLAPGATFHQMFAKAGTYSYHCTNHPNMKATIVVT